MEDDCHAANTCITAMSLSTHIATMKLNLAYLEVKCFLSCWTYLYVRIVSRGFSFKVDQISKFSPKDNCRSMA